MGFLTKSSRIKELETKAVNWDALVTAVQKSDSSLTTEQITPEMITDALSVDNTDTDSAALVAANNRITELTNSNTTFSERIAELEAENNTLRGLPVEDPAGVSSDSETGGKPQDFATFAKKNNGNHAAILDQAKKEGLI